MALSERRRIVYRFMELPHTRQRQLLKEFDLIAEGVPSLVPFLSREDKATVYKTAFERIAERGILEVFGTRVDSETAEVHG